MTDASKNRIARLILWGGRILSLLVVGMALVMFVREGGFDPRRLSLVEGVEMVLFWSVCAGLLLAWRWAGLGGAVSILCVLLFYLIEFAGSGSFPRGWALVLMAVPGLLFVLYWWMTRAPQEAVEA